MRAIYRPAAADDTMGRVQCRGYAAQEFVGVWPEMGVLVAGRFGVRIDAGDLLVQELADSGEREVVERVHRWVLELVWRLPAVPVPHGGGAEPDLIAP